MNDNTKLRMLKVGIAEAETLAEAKDVISALGLGNMLVTVPYSHEESPGIGLGKVICTAASTNLEGGE